MTLQEIVVGDCLEKMKLMRDNCVDAIVCDPPYGLSSIPDIVEVLTHWLAGDDYKHRGGGFQGKTWDSFVPGPAVWREAYRVLKPGGHALIFAASRTVDLTGIAVRLAKFEVRDQLQWLYGVGFPKSLNFKDNWQGWGTALKPAFEPVIVMRKQPDGTITSNLLKWGTGALNIDSCRIEADDNKTFETRVVDGRRDQYRTGGAVGNMVPSDVGRWPANVLFDDAAAAVLDQETGAGTSRFFYCTKTSASEREAGLDHLPKKSAGELTDREDGSAGLKSPRAGAGRTSGGRANNHPTVKPIALMRYLCRLVTPPGGLVLDPFSGSGTTGCAAALEGFSFIGIEQDPDYARIAEARIAHWSKIDIDTEKKVDAKNGHVVEGIKTQADEIIPSVGEFEIEEEKTPNTDDGESKMAWLPPGMAEEVANAKPTYGRERVNDGDYTFMHKKCSYEQTKKGPAVIIEHRIMSAKRIKEDVEPNAVGTDVSYFLPNYGDAAVMLQPNLKMYVCGLLGVDADKVSGKDIVDTIQAMGDERQLAKGMLIQGTTFHTKKKSDGEDFMGFNWKPVAGENTPSAPSVAARRAELDRGGSTTVPGVAAASPAVAGNAPAIAPSPPAPPSPTPPAPAANPLVGWTPNPNDPNWYYRFLPNGTSEQKLKNDLLAGR